jgi:hypothetical protein
MLPHEQKKYLELLNQDAPKNHTAIQLIFDGFIRKRYIACSCGKHHPTGSLDTEFVIWDSLTTPSKQNLFNDKNYELPDHAWKWLSKKS